jgi:hypothetical protein
MDILEQFGSQELRDITLVSEVVTKFAFAVPAPISPFHDAILNNLGPAQVLPEAPNRSGIAQGLQDIRDQLKRMFEAGSNSDHFRKRGIASPVDYLAKVMRHYYNPDQIYTNGDQFVTVLLTGENLVESMFHKSIHNLVYPFFLDPPECLRLYREFDDAEPAVVKELTSSFRPPVDRFEAMKNSERNQPMPTTHITLRYERVFTAKEYERLQIPLIPEEMEDKWFIYMENECLHFIRSWSGHRVYQVQFDEMRADGSHVAAMATLNRDPIQYKHISDEYDLKLLDFLINALLLKIKGTKFPKPSGLGPDVPEGLYQHAIAGTGYKEE